ncbi:hypothetical protein Lal_00029545 [Lupinus albus]|nr:hypothetical protein Lal_00029545 [Lupinus albus]
MKLILCQQRISYILKQYKEKIPTKEALLKRWIPLNNNGGSLCAFCNELSESTNHLFSSCKFTYSVWKHLYKWLNIIVARPLTHVNHFTYHLARNDLVLHNVIPSITSILDSTKVKSWLWIKTMAGMETFYYSLWISNPLGIINILM